VPPLTGHKPLSILSRPSVSFLQQIWKFTGFILKHGLALVALLLEKCLILDVFYTNHAVWLYSGVAFESISA
jgi:hypothetical protein